MTITCYDFREQPPQRFTTVVNASSYRNPPRRFFAKRPNVIGQEVYYAPDHWSGPMIRANGLQVLGTIKQNSPPSKFTVVQNGLNEKTFRYSRIRSDLLASLIYPRIFYIKVAFNLDVGKTSEITFSQTRSAINPIGPENMACN